MSSCALRYDISSVGSSNKEEEMEEVLLFLREYFFPQEPCARAIDLCPHGYRIPELERQLKSTMSLGMSLAAREEKSGQLLGVIIMDILQNGKKDDDNSNPDHGDMKCQDLPSKAKRLFRMFDHITTDGGKSSVFQATGASTAYDVFIISTSDKARNRGVGTALMRAAMEECSKRSKHDGIRGKSVVQCMALSAYTIRICKKLGFQTLFKLAYADYQDEEGFMLADKDMGVHTTGQLLAKDI